MFGGPGSGVGVAEGVGAGVDGPDGLAPPQARWRTRPQAAAQELVHRIGAMVHEAVPRTAGPLLGPSAVLFDGARRIARLASAMTRVPRLALASGLASGLALLLVRCGGPSSPVAPPPPSATPAPRPNLVLVVVDDLDVPTYEALPRLNDLLARQGLSFTRSYATTPLCAPSRASILTGQYAHNHGVTGVAPPDQGFPAFRRHEGATLATWLRAAGYRTSLVGKYQNAYAFGTGSEYVPPGWDDWFGHLTQMEDGRYWNYWVNDNRDVVRYGNRQDDYSVDVETRRAMSFIRAQAGRAEPLFLYLAPQAPHIPANYHERYGADFREAECPRVPSFNETNVGDKPAWVRKLPLMGPRDIDRADELQRWRLRSMRAVEDQIDAVIQALSETGRLATTYLVFTSDNGLLMGQHRAVASKNNPYEEAARVPLVIRGPGVSTGEIDLPALNIDIAPTLLELAGLPVPDSIDGRSLAPFVRGSRPSAWRREVLIENWNPGPTYALRTDEWLYVHNETEEFELYDMKADPWQAESLHRWIDPAVLATQEQRLTVLAACRGAACRN